MKQIALETDLTKPRPPETTEQGVDAEVSQTDSEWTCRTKEQGNGTSLPIAQGPSPFKTNGTKYREANTSRKELLPSSHHGVLRIVLA